MRAQTAGQDRNGENWSQLKSHVFISPEVMIVLAFVAERMSITPRPVLWSRIDLEVEGPSWSGTVYQTQHHRTRLVVIAGKLNAVLYREAILIPHPSSWLILTWLSSMTITATSHSAHHVCGFLRDRNASGQRSAQILFHNVTRWIGTKYIFPGESSDDRSSVLAAIFLLLMKCYKQSWGHHLSQNSRVQ